MKIGLYFFLPIYFSISCTMPEVIDIQDFSKGIGLVYQIDKKKIPIYSSQNISKIADYFSAPNNDRNVLFDKLELEKTHFRNFEYGYEEYYLPVIQEINGGKVLKVIYQNSSGRYEHGYIENIKTQIKFLHWNDHLVKQPLFFTDSLDYKIYEFQNGPEIELDNSSFENHIMWPEFEKDGWMQVKLITPSDYCEGKVNSAQVINGMIKYLDEKGTPLVWYFTRGC